MVAGGRSDYPVGRLGREMRRDDIVMMCVKVAWAERSRCAGELTEWCREVIDESSSTLWGWRCRVAAIIVE